MPESDFITVSGFRLEYQFLNRRSARVPTLVFLHEGLGCVSLWRDFPARLAERTGMSALVYSRAGYGKSDPVSLPRPVRYMHDEAEVLDTLLKELNINNTVLIGHSDGASIALIYAGLIKCVNVRALILEAPHVFTEQGGLDSIARVTDVYRTTAMRERLKKHHGSNTDIAFRGWNDVWLHPEFRAWNIEEFLPVIAVPLLLIQGDDDEYGTIRQLEAIERQVKGTVEVLKVADCGHSPHREQAVVTLGAMTAFLQRYCSGWADRHTIGAENN